MKKSLILLFCLASLTGFAQVEKVIRGSTAKSVKIYQSGAQVERQISTSVDAGMTTLFIEGLSATIDPNSILVTGTGDAAVTGTSYQLDYLINERKPLEVRNLEDSLRMVNTEIEKTNSLEQVYNEEINLLNANRSVGGANVGVDVDMLKEVADFYRERMLDLKNKQIEVRAEQRQLKDRQDRINRQLQELNAKNNRPQGTIVIGLLAKQATKLSLKVGYFTTGASWSPAYDIRANSLAKPVQLNYKAEVRQSCTEDWEDVRLSLSTGNPSVGSQKPDLQPWYLNFYEPRPVVYMKSSRGYNAEAAPSVMMEAAASDLETMADFTTVIEGAATTEFEITEPYTVRGDGKPVSVDIRSYELPATFTYFASPKLDHDAFLLARVTGWDQLNLLPGPAKTYLEGNYVGQSTVDPRITTDTMDFSLGRDKRIVVTREAQSELTKSKTAAGNTVKEQHYRITVRNTRKEPVSIMLEDQLPVSQNTDIKVSDREYSEGILDEATGRVVWRLDLAAGASETKTIGYTVKYPKDKMVTGY